jgi:type II secretory pathway component PulC
VAVDLPTASVEYYRSNLAELLDSAFATPRLRDTANGQRVIDGYQIDRIRPEGVAAQVGLRNGDVILEINGQALDGLATILKLFGEIEKMTQMRVTVLRDGQKLTFVVKKK